MPVVRAECTELVALVIKPRWGDFKSYRCRKACPRGLANPDGLHGEACAEQIEPASPGTAIGGRPEWLLG
jgi:hypothetical protein